MGKKATGGKKKGPKGKKARAKAKLERQWGEELTEEQLEQAKKQRRGTVKQTRPVSSNSLNRLKDPVKSNVTKLPEQETEDEQSDEEEQDDQDHHGNALNSLLQSIQKNSLIRSKAIDDEDDSDMSESGDIPTEHTSGDEQTGGDEDDAMLRQEEDMDLFGHHFNQPPLAADTKDSTETMTKIAMGSLNNDSIEMHVSSKLLYELTSSSGFHHHQQQGKSADGFDLNWRRVANKSASCIRKALSRTWQGTGARNGSSGGNNKMLLTPLQRVLFPCMARYADILMAAESRDNREEVSRLLRLHVLNHVITSRSRIQRHNHRLKEMAKEDETGVAEPQEKFQDQGYTRPTVLVLLPTRGTCYSFVKGMLQLLGEGHVDNLDRFEAEFGAIPVPVDGNKDMEAERRRKLVLEKKGKDWLELFGDDVNDDDDFKIGISLTPKTARNFKPNTKGAATDGQEEHTNVSMKLFTDFYRSDIVLASPLALKLMSATTDSNKDGDEEEAEQDYDFLSSIEICVLARMDVLLMQNMDHVTSVLSLLNQQPKTNKDIDFSRVREYCLAGQAARWRQLIVCSNITDPQILSLFKRFATSYAGSIKLKRTVTSDDCSIGKVLLPVRQVFQRVHCSSLAEQGDAKLKYFMDKLLPTILQRKQKHTMIFVPSYFDFISLRNILLKREVDFVSVSEYARVSEVTRSRARFLQGLKPILLYTGRAHYFSRHDMKGVKHLIFWGLPEQSDFYVDLIHGLGQGLNHKEDNTLLDPSTSSSGTCLALFTKYEAHALERIAGKEDCRKMLKSEKTAFAFTSS